MFLIFRNSPKGRCLGNTGPHPSSLTTGFLAIFPFGKKAKTPYGGFWQQMETQGRRPLGVAR